VGLLVKDEVALDVKSLAADVTNERLKEGLDSTFKSHFQCYESGFARSRSFWPYSELLI
jgi:hypothetical protein